MTQHHAAVESIHAFYLTVFPSKYCIYQQSTRRGGRTMQVCLASSMGGPQVSVRAYMFTYSSIAVKFVGGMLMTPA
jgi:hypothetical protein